MVLGGEEALLRLGTKGSLRDALWKAGQQESNKSNKEEVGG